jgi:hypothetical protein
MTISSKSSSQTANVRFTTASRFLTGVFQELRDVDYFKQARPEGGTVVWPHEQDICPDTLYEASERVAPAAKA